jgi:hypothetical protein
MKMKRETAELYVNALERTFESLGINLMKLAAQPGMEYTIKLLPKNLGRFFKYGADREGAIRFFMEYGSEPSAGERNAIPLLAVQLPQLLREAALKGPAFQFPDELPTPNYRSKIGTEEYIEVRKEVRARIKKSKTYAQAIHEVAEIYGVHTRTIRRICPRVE